MYYCLKHFSCLFVCLFLSVPLLACLSICLPVSLVGWLVLILDIRILTFDSRF